MKTVIMAKEEFDAKYGKYRFGYALPEKQEIYIRKNLPPAARNFVEQHERYHVNDKGFYEKGQFWREFDANVHAATQHPFGFLQTIFLTVFSASRWMYYFRRAAGKES